MKHDDQVCSLDLAKRLKQLGVKQDSFFRWEVRSWGKPALIWQDYHDVRVIDTADARQYFDAFTVAELGEMLPMAFQSGKRPYDDKHPKAHKYECYPYEPVHGKHIPTQTAATEADARAKMLIYLVENQLIKTEM